MDSMGKQIYDVLYSMRLAPRHQLEQAAKEVAKLFAAPPAPADAVTTKKPVAWVEVLNTRQGPYYFHRIEFLPVGKHNLFVVPPAPVAADNSKAEYQERCRLQARINYLESLVGGYEGYKLVPITKSALPVPDSNTATWHIERIPVVMQNNANAIQIRLHIGHQSFDINDPCDTEEEADFMERMLRKALDRIAKPAATAPAGWLHIYIDDVIDRLFGDLLEIRIERDELQRIMLAAAPEKEVT